MQLILTILILTASVFFANTKPFEDDVQASSCPVADPNALNVHIVPHSHDDVGWQVTYEQYYYLEVESIISSVVAALRQDPKRRFVQVETAFFKKWWDHQNDVVKSHVRELVNNGQFEIINGAWSMNDEAAVYYQSTIDQFTLGLRFLEDQLGECGRARVGWQIDPFGHSREHASILAQIGFDGLFFARVDYRDRRNRSLKKTSDMMWRASSSLGNTSDIFTSVLYNHYSAPNGFCFDIVCGDEPIIDDKNSGDYNYEARMTAFANVVRQQAAIFPTNNILITMGDDFRYTAASTTFINLDKLIKGFDIFNLTASDGRRMKAFYSSPSCYAKAVNEYVTKNNRNLERKTDDFFPYADTPNTPWTGYFISRPASKGFERKANNFLQIAKQLAANTKGLYANADITALKEAVGVMQHHDAITGTEKQAVTKNYHYLLAKAMNRSNTAACNSLTNLMSSSSTNGCFNLDSCLLANVSSCTPSTADKFTVVVYNPSSQVVSHPVSIPVPGRSYRILDSEKKQVESEIATQIRDFSYVKNVSLATYDLEFTAKNLPPLGYKVYTFEKLANVEATSTVDRKVSPRAAIGYNETNFALASNGLLQSVTMNGITLDVQQDFLFYESATSSGAYIFVPRNNTPRRIATTNIKTTPLSGPVYEGVLQEFSPWVRQEIKVYNDDRGYIEFDWIVGPIPVNDQIGKEVITQFTTSLKTGATFYTDSNGRELLKRVRNFRPDYNYTNEQPVSGNYYPINTRILMRDEAKDIELAVITDRSQGGSSIEDGQIELMVHRACIRDDGRGVGEILNEQEYQNGIVVRGKSYLVIGKKNGDGKKSLRAIERELALRKNVQPWTFVTNSDISTKVKNAQFSGLTKPLPENVQVLTLEPWFDNDTSLLIRLEHIFEKGDDANLSKDVTIDLADAFTQFTVKELRETFLAGSHFVGSHQRMQWPGSSSSAQDSPVLSDVTRAKRAVTDTKITLAPMQIRTFLAKIVH